MEMPTLEDAIALSARLHKGQKDKAGMEYILHPLRVMLNPSLTYEEERIVAVLHDTLEDCGLTPEKLRELGYSEEIITSLRFLTKLPEEENNYGAFIDRICRGPVTARKVKLADLMDNSNLTRIPLPSEKDYKRNEKYLLAIRAINISLHYC